MAKVVLIVSVMLLSYGFGQTQPVDWHPPIQGQVLLSGTFGELRGSHYHAGIDIKANVSGPQDILATADGYVKEVRVRGGSYGNALILQHPNGYRSLYGHLDHFIPELDSLVYAHQYDQNAFEVTIELDSAQFPVQQGMKIAVMGNTGYSFGRHLHFEVRHVSGTMYNPLLVLPELQDDTPPQFRNLKINYHDEWGREFQEKIISVRALGNGRYSAGNLVLNTFKYSLGVDVVDLHRNTHNRNGIYSIEMLQDTNRVYFSVLDSLSADDRKYYEEHIDHIDSPESQAIYHNLRYASQDITTQLQNSQAGLFRLLPFLTQEYTVIATDYQGNRSSLTFSIRQVENPSIDYEWMYNYVIPAGVASRVHLDQYAIIFPEKTFARDQRLYIYEEITVQDGEPVVMIHMNEDQIPLYEAPLLVLESDMPEKEKQSWTLARCTGNGYSAIRTMREKERFAARIGRMTSYCLIRDTIPPRIEFQPQNSRLWYFRVRDDMHAFSSLKYSAKVNGHWVLVGADDKNNRLFFRDFDRFRINGTNRFELQVTDACGNTAVFEKSF